MTTRHTKIINQPKVKVKRRVIPVDPKHKRAKVKVIEAGADEATVELLTFRGPRKFRVDPKTLLDNSVFVGTPIRSRTRFYLIDFPRQSAEPARVWVTEDQLVHIVPEHLKGKT